jgi:mono/diheme cytochrome c family protein
MKSLLLLLAASAAWAQNVADVVKRGEELFNKTCSSGYCHGARGSGGGAPRLAARGFEQAYIASTVRRGVPGTQMASFSATLPPADLNAIAAYVATLNGIANPGVGGRGATAAGPALSGDAARGRALFSDAVRGFGRCSTCHEVGGIGIPVAVPIAKVPANAAALKSVATPSIATATLSGESMPVLVLSKRSQSVKFYDMTTPPPVLRTVEPSAIQISEGNAWKHSSVIGAYNDAELTAILAYCRAVVR